MVGKLTPSQEKFAIAHGAGMNLQDAALHAGYKPGSARVRGQKLMKVPAVAAAVEAERAKAVAETRIKGAFDNEQAMRALDEAIEFAKLHKNPNAYVKALEAKAKISGLMSDNKGAVAGFQLIINGIDKPMKDVNV